MEVDEALAQLGTIGRWQICYFLMISAACMVMPCLHMLVINYIGEYTCTQYMLHYKITILKTRHLAKLICEFEDRKVVQFA